MRYIKKIAGRAKKSGLIIYFATAAFAVLFIVAGNRIASDGWAGFGGGYDGDSRTAEARVSAILDVAEWRGDAELYWMADRLITFEAVITGGAERGATVTAFQHIADYFPAQPGEVAEGERIILIFLPGFLPGETGEWHFLAHARINTVAVLGAAFALLLIIFGRAKGFNAILSLGFTCAAIFAVFLPSILSGRNIYAAALSVCVYSVVVTLFILNGVNKKSLAAAAGCLGGVFAAALLTLLTGGALRLTGMVDREFEMLLFLPTPTGQPIDLNALIFAGLIIGASGAVMDVAVSISSALWELKRRAPELPFGALLKSGLNIGRDIMGSMTNTLVLAYIGSSLPVILLLLANSDSLADLLNREMVIVELLQAIIGAVGILLAMPLTALACAAMYSNSNGRGVDKTGEGGEYFEELAELERLLNNSAPPLPDKDGGAAQ